MKKMKKELIALVFVFVCVTMYAGNPDRAGSAGTSQLLLNPWGVLG